MYSTCSLEPEENEEVVEKALSGQTQFSVMDCRSDWNTCGRKANWCGATWIRLVSGGFVRTIPGVHPCDGFFVAMLQKN